MEPKENLVFLTGIYCFYFYHIHTAIYIINHGFQKSLFLIIKVLCLRRENENTEEKSWDSFSSGQFLREPRAPSSWHSHLWNSLHDYGLNLENHFYRAEYRKVMDICLQIRCAEKLNIAGLGALILGKGCLQVWPLASILKGLVLGGKVPTIPWWEKEITVT